MRHRSGVIVNIGTVWGLIVLLLSQRLRAGPFGRPWVRHYSGSHARWCRWWGTGQGLVLVGLGRGPQHGGQHQGPVRAIPLPFSAAPSGIRSPPSPSVMAG